MLQLADKLPERYEGQRKASANRAVGNLAFPYSLYFVFYEQYAFIQVLILAHICGVLLLTGCNPRLAVMRDVFHGTLALFLACCQLALANVSRAVLAAYHVTGMRHS